MSDPMSSPPVALAVYDVLSLSLACATMLLMQANFCVMLLLAMIQFLAVSFLIWYDSFSISCTASASHLAWMFMEICCCMSTLLLASATPKLPKPFYAKALCMAAALAVAVTLAALLQLTCYHMTFCPAMKLFLQSASPMVTLFPLMICSARPEQDSLTLISIPSERKAELDEKAPPMVQSFFVYHR